MLVDGTIGGVTASAGLEDGHGAAHAGCSSIELTDDSRLAVWMGIALDEARAAVEHDDVPVGAVVVAVDSGAVIARRHNERELTADPTAHAEVLALRDAAGALGRWRLDGHALIVTVEPCPMCAGAAWAARVDTIVFGTPDSKAGAVGSLYNLAADPRLNHDPGVVTGVRAEEAAALVRSFFEERRRT